MPASARAQAEAPAPLGRVIIAVGGQSVLYHLPLALADQLGYFRAEGLEVIVRDFPAGALALKAVQDGVADVCSGAYEHTIRQQSRAEAYRSLVVQGRAPQLALGVSLRALPRYQALQDLRGRRVGVSSVGSSTQFAASLVLARAGIAPQEVSFISVGSGLQAVNALRSGQVHALCHADPIMTLLEQKADTRIVGDLRSLKAAQDMFGGSMPASCLYAPQTFVQKRAAQAQALANGVVHALKWLQTAGPADIVKAVPPGYLMGDRGAYLAAFSRVRETYSTNGLMPDEGPATAQRVLARVHPELAEAKLDLGRTYTNEFVRKARQKFNV